MTLYNITGLQNAETIVDLVVYANQATAGTDMLTRNGILMGGFLITIFAIIFMAYSQRKGVTQALLTSGFICFVLSIFLRLADMVSFLLVLAFGFTMGISGLMLAMEKRDN